MPELDDYSKEQKVIMETWMVNTLKLCKEKGIGIHQKRSFTFERIEMVVYQSDIKDWEEIFSLNYGGFQKKPGDMPTDEDKKLTRTYGGINELQTLFAQEVEELPDMTAIAMIWPWNDEEHMTLHMGFVKTDEDQDRLMPF